VIRARLGSGIRLEQMELTPALLASFKHAASMPNLLFYERQRGRISTWGCRGSCTASTRPSTVG
jgi:hypothetical protein